MPPLEAPTIGSLLTLTGNAAVVSILVTVIKRTFQMTAAQVDRFGPILAIGCGILLALFAGLVTQQTGQNLAQSGLTGFISGAVSMGLYATFGPTVQQVASTVTGGAIEPPKAPGG